MRDSKTRLVYREKEMPVKWHGLEGWRGDEQPRAECELVMLPAGVTDAYDPRARVIEDWKEPTNA